jgi:hypothetical protein
VRGSLIGSLVMRILSENREGVAAAAIRFAVPSGRGPLGRNRMRHGVWAGRRPWPRYASRMGPCRFDVV